jgi:hypothetical protein
MEEVILELLSRVVFDKWLQHEDRFWKLLIWQYLTHAEFEVGLGRDSTKSREHLSKDLMKIL